MFRSIFQKLLSTSFISLGILTPLTASAVQSTPVAPEALLTQNPQDQTEGYCLEVTAMGSGLYVRSQPTVYSEAVAVLQDGQQVTSLNIPPIGNGWLPVVAPVKGYVFADFLQSCAVDDELVISAMLRQSSDTTDR